MEGLIFGILWYYSRTSTSIFPIADILSTPSQGCLPMGSLYCMFNLSDPSMAPVWLSFCSPCHNRYLIQVQLHSPTGKRKAARERERERESSLLPFSGEGVCIPLTVESWFLQPLRRLENSRVKLQCLAGERKSALVGDSTVQFKISILPATITVNIVFNNRTYLRMRDYLEK